jgi:uncharacterized membrane protein
MKYNSLKKISLYLTIVLFAAAGINHFVHPSFYEPMMPPYLPAHSFLNYAAGFAEIAGAILLLFSATRKWGSYLLVATLIAFIPAHIYMIQVGGCMSKDICLPLWGAWVRLCPLQFLLIWWVWSVKSMEKL